MWRITRQSLLQDARIRYIVLIDSLMGALCITLYWFTQPYQVEAGLPLGFFGLSHALIVTCGALAALNTHRLSRHLPDKYFLGGIAATATLCYVLLGVLPPTIATIGLIVLIRTVWGCLQPLSFDLINRMTTTDVRATVLSIRGMAFQIFFAIFPPFFAAIADHTSLRLGLLSLGLFLGIVMTVLFVLMEPVWKRIPAAQ